MIKVNLNTSPISKPLVYLWFINQGIEPVIVFIVLLTILILSGSLLMFYRPNSRIVYYFYSSSYGTYSCRKFAITILLMTNLNNSMFDILNSLFNLVMVYKSKSSFCSYPFRKLPINLVNIISLMVNLNN